MKKIFLIISVLLLSACSLAYTDKNYDKYTDYSIANTNTGFNVTLIYSRYQFIMSFDKAYNICKNKAIFIALEEAYKRNKKILPIDLSNLETSMGRNSFTGVTSCTEHLKVYWDKAEQ